MTLTFRRATRHDRTVREAFTCTSVPRPGSRQRNTSYDGSWEREAQAFVREPPWRTAIALLVFDGDDLVAIGHHDVRAPDAFEIQVIAVSLSRQGEGIGGQVLDHLLELAAGGAGSAGMDPVVLLARVHQESRASRRLMARAGVEGVAAERENLIDYAMRLDVATGVENGVLDVREAVRQHRTAGPADARG